MAKKGSDDSVFAGLLYLVSILGVLGWVITVILWAVKKDESKLVNYHFKQWLMMIIVGIAIPIACVVFTIVTLGFGVFVAIPVMIITAIFMLVIWVMGMINGFTGKKKPLPLIGTYAEKWFTF